MSYRKLHPEAVWPFIGMLAGAIVGALSYNDEHRWPIYLFTSLGCIAGFIVNAVKKSWASAGSTHGVP